MSINIVAKMCEVLIYLGNSPPFGIIPIVRTFVDVVAKVVEGEIWGCGRNVVVIRTEYL